MAADIIRLISGDKDVATLAVSVVALLALLFVADLPIERRPFFGRAFWAVVDSAVHGFVALLVTAPIIRSAPAARQLLALAFLAGTLVDLDHFLAAGHRSFWSATHLARRPPTHSLTFALLVSGGRYLVLWRPHRCLDCVCGAHLPRSARYTGEYNPDPLDASP